MSHTTATKIARHCNMSAGCRTRLFRFSIQAIFAFGAMFMPVSSVYAGLVVAVAGGVDKVSPSGTVTPFATGMSFPLGLAFGNNGVLFVADETAGTVREVDPLGNVSDFRTGFTNPTAVAVADDGDVFVLDFNGITKLNSAGTILSTFPNLYVADAIAVDSGGNLLAAESNWIDKVTPSGAVSKFATIPGGSHHGLALDSSGNLYLSNYSDNSVTKVTQSGDVSTFATGFDSPYGLAFDIAGDLFVSNVGNDTISKVTPAGGVTTFAHGLSDVRGLAFESNSVPEPSTTIIWLTAIAYAGGASVWRRRRLLES